MDYKYFTFEASQANQSRKWMKPTTYGFLACGVIVLGWLTFKTPASEESSHLVELSVANDASAPQSKRTIPAASKKITAPTPQSNDQSIMVTVKRGDSLAKIFKAHRLDPLTLQRILDLGDVVKPLIQIKPKQEIQLLINDAQQLKQLHYSLNSSQTLIIRYINHEFTAELIEKPIEIQQRYVTATIHHSLYLAAKKAQLPNKIIHQLGDLFAWNIDFAKELRSGDQFTVLFEEHHIDGEVIDSGNIIAAKFINRSNTHTAIRHIDAQGQVDYFSIEGNSLRKAFLRYPVKHSHISSAYNPKRLHPILKVIRPHLGVDLAAALGTPIKAAGDGVIEKRGGHGGYGNMIVIRHNNTYKTLYAHMLRFAKGLHVGSRVKQGQVIGYVGQTGLANGPHLHYEFHVNGKTVNPVTVKLPNADPIANEERDRFFAQAIPALAQLEQYETMHTNATS
ncbi:MAG: peptidoglycan DD-metalloendopeptidase family protein [Legionellales bacterium]|nr:peptidoglycan DD-metalloendopeptidase family protein [Legionellales bacterium]